MSTLPFGQARHIVHRRRRATLLLGVSAAAIILLTPARAETITYSAGETRSAPIVLVEEADLVTGAGVLATQSGPISGDYGIVKQGAGRLTLTGTNSYTGGTRVEDGFLAIQNATALGTGAVTLENAGSLIFSGSSTMSLSNDLVLNGTGNLQSSLMTTLTGTVSGGGDLKFIAGSFALSGANTFAGDTYVGALNYATYLELLSDTALSTGKIHLGQAGNLALGQGVTIGNDLVLTGGKVNGLRSLGTATYAGNISEESANAGLSLRGDTILTGSSTYGGRTYISAGSLTAGRLNALSAQSVYQVEANATLRLLYDQQIGGLADGGTSFGRGTLDLTNRRLTVLQTGVSTFGGTVIGTENSRIMVTEGGTLNFTGDSADFAGTFIIDNGRININADFSGAEALARGGEISGTGTIGYVGLTNGGRLVGNSGQQLTMSRLVMSSGSSLDVSLGLANNIPLFHVTGDVELDGYIDIRDAGGFGPGVYRILTYDGSLYDQTASIRDLPDGVEPEDVQLQLLSGQINIVSSADAGGGVSFWDGGNPDNWNNGIIDGGDGIWDDQAKFTTADGSTNGPLNPSPGFVVFGGTAGHVEIDGDYAAVTGMQFTTDGYSIDGGYLLMGSGDRVFRVGDGSAAGADYTATIDSAISGEGRLVKTDIGRLVLNNVDNDYTGGTEVRGGVLEVNGRIGDVLVGADGSLTGRGFVQSAQVQGRIGATGFDSLYVGGDLTMGDNAMFTLQVDAEGNNSLVEVNGVAHVDGTVQVLASGGDYADNTRYTFLRAQGGIDGTFDRVVDNLAFLRGVLEYSDNDVQLLLTRNGAGFGEIGSTPNQQATGIAVEQLGAGNTVYDRVLTYDIADAQNAFDQLSGEVYATSQGAMLQSTQSVAAAMGDRLDTEFAGLGQGSDSGLHLWSAATGRAGSIRGDGNAADAGFSAGNVFVGADAVFNQNWVFGATGGYGHTGVSVPDRASQANVDSFYAGIYGGGQVGQTTLKGGVAAGVNQSSVTRNVDIPGFSEQLHASRNGGFVQSFAEIGQKFAFDSGVVIEPFVNLTHTNIFSGTYAETGGVAALSGDGSNASLTTATLGVRGEADIDLGQITAKANVMVGLRQSLGGVDPTATHRFAGGQDFTVAGAPVAQTAAVVRAGLDFDLAPNTTLGVQYDGVFSSAGASHGIKASFSLKF